MVDVAIQSLDRITIQRPGERQAGRLLDAALAEPVHELPYAEHLERHFGQELDWVRVRYGGLATAALDSLGAQAATRGCDVFLRETSPSIEVVAHEVVHALQARTEGPGAAGVVGEHSAPEVEAARALQAPVQPASGLAPGAIALLRRSPVGDEPVITLDPARTPDTPSLAAPPTATASAAPESAPERSEGPGNIQEQAVPGDATSDEAGLVLPDVAEPALTPEDIAAREQAIAEAEAGLAAADSASALLQAFASAPPTVKARQAASLSDQLTAIAPAETERWQGEVPSIDADLQGAGGAPPDQLRVDAPPAVELQLEPEGVAPAPEPEIAGAPEAEPFTANDGVRSIFGHLSEPPPEQLADAIGDTLDAVQTTDPSIPRSPGPPPTIPLEGETDPARIAGQEEAAGAQAGQLREEAMRAVVDGPGPEQVQPMTLHESYAVEPVQPVGATALDVPEGPGTYLALGLPPEVQASFDEQQQVAMQESMAEATAQADEATRARDTARDEAVATAEDGAATLNEKAQTDQVATVVGARSRIQTERQSAIDAQHAEVARVRGEATERRRTDEAAIDTRVGVEQQAIDDSYATAETDIADTVAEGERDAQAEQEQAEREAEDQSWWDRAVSFVQDAFDALVSAIGDIFDAVRAAVNAALDAVKAFALSVIDRLATFVKDAIAAFGEFLKLAVNALIGEIFPELAAELNAAIDTAVAEAQAAVDVVADGLKAGINALVEGLRAGINAALNAFEAAISFAVSVVGAALTGDWGLVIRKVLEAVLKLVGVDPESFYAFVGRAQETFDIIVNDPLGFLSNVVSAVVGGVQGFADRFTDHLKVGVIGWLTGTLGRAGITLPETFDLVGVLDLARQVLGLTWERVRAKAATLIGEQNVERLEYVGGYLTTLVTEGWPSLWDKIKGELGNLTDLVFDGIKSFLMERVVLAMIKKIPALFGPVGAIVQLVMTAWNLYEFLRDQLSRIGELVRSVVATIGDIARGVLTAAVAKVEEVLGNLVPVALDLLARLLGLGDLGEDVRKVIDKVQELIDRAIDGLITRVLGLFTGRGAADAAQPAGGEPTVAEAPTGGSEPLLVDEPFRVAGEDHVIRAEFVDGQATILMASDTFLAVLVQLDRLLANLRHLYTDQGGWFHGTPRAEHFEQEFEAIEELAHGLLGDVQKETDPAGERVAATKGIKELKRAFNALGLPEATQHEASSLPPHRVRGQKEATWGRAEWCVVDPLTVNSLGRGGPSGLGIPGITILDGYDEGHLVARSLGGPGTAENLAPMSQGTNRKWIGVRSIEDSVFKALTLTDGVEEAAPGYVIRYRTSCTYNPAGGLEAELTSKAGASAGVERRLFSLAKPGTEIPQGRVVAELGRPVPVSQVSLDDLEAQVRRRLAFHFMPTKFSIDVQVQQQPEREDFRHPIAASQTVNNHIGSNVDWKS